MSLTYTKIEPNVLRNTFVVTFSFEHRDADKTTTKEMKVPLSKEKFVHYLAKVSYIAAQINEARTSGESLPEDFKDTAKYNSVWIPVELDCFSRNNMSNYYADMTVESIVYFDEDGEQFEVSK